MTATIRVTAGRTLRADGFVTKRIAEGWVEVEIVTGTGGWNRPGKRIAVRTSITSPLTPAPAPVVEAPAAPAPEAPAAPVESTESAELIAARAEVERIEKALVANFDRVTGGRGKQGLRRTDAAIRRGAAYARELTKARALVAFLESTPAPVADSTPVEVPRTAIAVRDQFGWHKVVQVNAKSVTVRTAYSWDDRIALGKITDYR